MTPSSLVDHAQAVCHPDGGTAVQDVIFILDCVDTAFVAAVTGSRFERSMVAAGLPRPDGKVFRRARPRPPRALKGPLLP